MTMTITELERSLRALRLSGMTATLESRALQVAQQQMDFIEAFSALVQDELDRRRSRLIERRFALSGLTERKDLKDFDWHYNPKNPRREILELANLKFIDEREDALFIGSPGVGKSHIAKALALLAVQRGYTVFYREAHVLVEGGAFGVADEVGTRAGVGDGPLAGKESQAECRALLVASGGNDGQPLGQAGR